MSSTTMQAVRLHGYGGPEMLTYEHAPRPIPQADQVLIRVLAAGVNPIDWKIREGYLKEYIPLSFPWIPGYEGAGIIEEVGADVTTFKPGQSVYGIFIGGYAEYALAPASDLQLKPPHLTFEEAASVPMGALTAWSAVIESANVQPGQRVLVHGAAGGVGLYATQFACWKGAQVIGTSSANNADFVRSLCAGTVIDYNATPFENVVRDLDVVIDTVGGDTLERSWKVIRPDGVLVTVAAFLPPDAGKAYGVRAIGAARAPTEKLGTISELLEAKQLKTAIAAMFPLAETRQAQELCQKGHGRGRIILLTA